jgi:hypothetical protein
MKRAQPLLRLIAFSAVVGALRAEDARAEWSGAALVGDGFNNSHKIGIGARAGYSFESKFYIGGAVVYHFGTQLQTVGNGNVRLHIFYMGAEGGYDLAAGPMTVRPYLGFGYANARNEILDLSTSAKIVTWPGVAVFVPIDSFFVGADGRLVYIFHGLGENGFGVFVTGGAVF